MATKLINLTPHEVVLMDESGEAEIARIPVAGEVARLEIRATDVERVEVDGVFIPVISPRFEKVQNLPGPKPDVMYITSVRVAWAVRALRGDVVALDIGHTAVREADGPNKGQIRGVRRFIR